MPDFTFAPTGSLISDVGFRDDVGYIQKYYPTNVDPKGFRRIIQYYHMPWSNSDYGRPYVVVVDTPKLLTYDPNGVNQVGPNNPSTWRVWVDNSKGFSTIDREITMNDIRVTLKVRKDSGFTIMSPTPADKIEVINGQQVAYSEATATITQLLARKIASVDFTVQADGNQNGNVPYMVVVDPFPIPAKTINGTILASTTPKVVVRQSANLISLPWTFTDTSWTNILGLQVTDFRAFTWDPVQNSYVISTGNERGKGAWIISPNDYGVSGKQLQGSPTSPTDIQDGAKAVTLLPGWNLVGNPYTYPIQLGQFTLFAASAPSTSLTWDQTVGQQFVSPYIATWVNDGAGSGAYSYVQGDTAVMQPNSGYWMFNATQQDIILQFPPLYLPGAPGSTRGLSVATKLTAQTRQTSSDWRLQLVARSATTVDDSNFIGIASNASVAKQNQVVKVPISPTQDVNLYQEGTVAGRAVRLAQSLTSGSGSQGYTFKVESLKDGSVTVTWPNLRSLPNNLNLRLTDTATGVTRNMRQTSGYTFQATANSTRAFEVDVSQGSAARPVIGDVVVTKPSRDPNGVFTIAYSLNTDATTSVRILAGSREVMSLVRGRADKLGSNSTTWNLRDSANRAVAPGTYQVEITAETNSGDRIRKIVTVNVIR